MRKKKRLEVQRLTIGALQAPAGGFSREWDRSYGAACSNSCNSCDTCGTCATLCSDCVQTGDCYG